MTATTPTVQYWNGSSWVDISTKVKSYSYTSGRRDEITGASAGRANIVFDNADSTVLGVAVNLLPKMTPVRVETYSNTQPRFSGWIDDSPVTFPSPEGTSSLVSVVASDSQALMQRHVCQTSMYEETLVASIQAGTPAGQFAPAGCGYWPLSDPVGSTSAYEATGIGAFGPMNCSPAPQGATTFGAAAINGAQTTSVTNLTATSQSNGSQSVAVGATLGMWVKWPAAAASITWAQSAGMVLHFGSSGSLILASEATGSGTNQFIAYANDGTNHNEASFTAALDSNWHYMQAVLTSAGVINLYVDGVLQSTVTVAGWSPSSTTVTTASIIGVPQTLPFGAAGNTYATPASVCHAWLGLGAAAGSSSSATNVFNSATLTLGGLTSTQFLGYLAKWSVPLYPFGANAIDSQNNGTFTPGAGVTFIGNDCLTLAQVAADTEDGPIFCTRSGVIANLTHDTLTDRATQAAAATFVNGDVEGDLTLARDSQYLITSAQITALSGSGGVQSAVNNFARFGNYPLQKSLYVTDYQAVDYATWKTQIYGDVNYGRVGQFTIDLLNSVDIQAAALSIDSGERVTFTGLPSQGGFTTADVIVQGFTENWTIDAWTITFNTVPSSSYVSWILEDATYGLLDTTTVLGY